MEEQNKSSQLEQTIRGLRTQLQTTQANKEEEEDEEDSSTCSSSDTVNMSDEDTA